MYKETRSVWGWALTVGFILILLLFLAIQTATLQGLVGGMQGLFPPLGEAQVGVVSLEGPMFTVEHHQRALKEYRERDNIKAVLLDVDSPGGGVAASQELADSIDELSEAGKPVVTSVQSVGASGAYYAAVSSDTIVANPGSLVGSIGVVMQFFQAQELMDTVGLEYHVVKSGEFKDLGSPFRDFEQRERELLQNLVLDVYDQFIEHILEHRSNLEEGELRAIADGRIFSGRQALDEGLIDEVGGRSEAMDILRKAADLDEDPRTVDLSRRQSGLLQATLQTVQSWVNALRSDHGNFRILYMMPGFNGS